MPATFVWCPLDPDGQPRVMKLADPGKPSFVSDETGETVRPGYGVSAITSGRPGRRTDRALCFVNGTDLTGLAADAQCADVLEEWFDGAALADWLALTPAGLGWSRSKLKRILDRMAAEGLDTTGLAMDSTFAEFLARATAAIDPAAVLARCWAA